MSERKSWDVVRKPVEAAHPVAVHAPVSVRRPARQVPKRPLREKRKKQRQFFWYILAGIIIALIAAAIYIIWLPVFRVDTVEAKGPDADAVKQLALLQMQGMYPYGVPRNSIFFLPEEKIRTQILKAYPDVSAVSIAPASLHGIIVTTTPRAAAFMWCGTSVDASPADGICFNADAEGLVFSPIDPSVTNATSTLRIFAPLDKDTSDGSSPVGTHVVNSQQIPDALRFVKMVRGLGAPVSALSISADEADLYLQGPTRIRYVIGREEEAALLANSVLPKLNLTDGSIEYIDLRFTSGENQPGKVYVKKFGE